MLLEQVGFEEQCQELNEGRIGVEATKKRRRQRHRLQPTERPVESYGRARQ